MKKFIVYCSTNFCGVEDWKEIWANDASEAEEQAAEEWLDEVYPHVVSVEECEEE